MSTKTRLATLIAAEQMRRGLTEREAATLCGVLQQTFSAWKRGVVPRDNKRQTLSTFLGISLDELNAAAADAESEQTTAKLPRIGSFDHARQYGRLIDEAEGKWTFDTSRKAVPEGRYSIQVDTRAMEPALRVGTRVWADPAVTARIGDEVMVHVDGGFAWIGVLQHYEIGRASITRPNGWRRDLDNVVAVHTIVLAERI